jgi:hypothetical protein
MMLVLAREGAQLPWASVLAQYPWWRVLFCRRLVRVCRAHWERHRAVGADGCWSDEDWR